MTRDRREYRDFHGNLLFTTTTAPDECSTEVEVEPLVAGVTGIRTLTIYSARAAQELSELLRTMMADTGH